MPTANVESTASLVAKWYEEENCFINTTADFDYMKN